VCGGAKAFSEWGGQLLGGHIFVWAVCFGVGALSVCVGVGVRSLKGLEGVLEVLQVLEVSEGG
jgi:hypothetical protein